MKVLIVGGAGYVGGAVTDILLAHPEHQIRVYDSLLYEDSYRKGVPFVRGDVRDRQLLLPHLQWADAVIWLAAIVGDAACALDQEVSTAVNQSSVEWLAEVFPRRIIFLSTCSVYGAADQVLDEQSATNPLSVYAVTKLAAESFLAGHPSALIFRLGTLFGLSDQFSRVRFDLVVNTLTLRAHQHNRISIFGGGQYRPLLHVRDAAEAVVRALGHSQTGVYNIHRVNHRISDLASQVAGHFPGLLVERTPTMFEDNRNYRVSSRKAEADLGFDPAQTVDQGIEEVRQLLVEGRLANPTSSRYWNDQFLAVRSGAQL